MATIHLPSSLSKYSNQEREIHVEANTLQKALEILADKFPALKEHIFDNNLNLLLHVAVFIDGEQLDTTIKNPVSLKPDSQIILVLALSGG